MPTSNGQVAGRNIRQSAIKTVHLVDESVTNPKLADLAVGVEQNAELLQISRSFATVNSEQTLTSSPQEFLSTSINVPTWAGEVSVLLLGRMQVSTGGTARQLRLQLTLNDPLAPTGAAVQTAPASSTTTLNLNKTLSRTTPGATVTARLWAWIDAGTETSHHEQLWALVWFQR